MSSIQPVQTSVLKTQATAQLEALDYIKKRRSGEISSLITPWNSWNTAHVDGIELGRIVTVAGMSASGKSAIVNQLSNQLHELNPNQRFSILIFNFEMTSKEIIIRNVISNLGISNRELLSADGIQLGDTEMLRVEALLHVNQANVNIYYCEYPKTVEEYKSICQRFYNKYGLKLIIITDHSVLFKKGMTDKDATATLYSLGDGSIELKKDIDCTQIHVSQLNRELEDESRRKRKSGLNFPTKGDLFGGDALYQCADTVLINHRPSLLNFAINTYGPDGWPSSTNDVYWHFLKLRQGTPGVSHMTADFSRFKILDKTAQQQLYA